jgi:hypothetical protein
MSTKNLAKVAMVLAQVSMLIAAAHAGNNEFQGVTIEVIDEVGVPEKEWHAAELFAEKIFQTAGVSATWTRCLWNPNTGNVDCPQPKAPNQISLLLLSEQSARRVLDNSDVFGIALEVPNGSFGSKAYIFHGRIQTKCAEKHDIQEPFLLGAVMAHEIGHLLLGPNSHSRIGIMKPDFEANNLPGVMLSALRFDDRQSKALRVAVAIRIQAAHSLATKPTLYISQASTP